MSIVAAGTHLIGFGSGLLSNGSTTSGLNPVGGNLSAGGIGRLSYEGFATYKNRVREGRGFTVSNSYTQVNLDASGWPTVGHDVILWEGSSSSIPPWATAANFSTPFKCGFIGAGTVSTNPGGSETIANFVAGNGTTTYSTFDLYGFTGNFFGWTNSAGAKNVFAYLPAYPGTVIDDPTQTSSLTNEAVALWKNFSMLRDMEASNAPGNTTNPNTSSTRRTNLNTQADQNWSGNNTEGYPKEWMINIVVSAGIGYYCNLPISDDGTSNSAGSYCSAVLNLILTKVIPTGQKVIFELGNEIWNGTASGMSGTLGNNAVAHGFATSLSDFTGILQYFGYLHHALANMCRTIFGSSFGVGKQVQLIMCYQMGGNGYVTAFPDVVNYLNTNYGTPNADIQGLGNAPYMNLSNNAGDTTPTLVLSDLTTQAGVAPYANGCEHTSIYAAHWGMSYYMYEGQWQLNAEATNSNISTVMASALLTPVLETWAKTCVDAGFKNINWFNVGVAQNLNSPYTDGLGALLWPPTTSNSPQLAAIAALSPGTYLSGRNVITNSGDSILGGNFSDLNGGTPYSLESADSYLPSFSYSVAAARFRIATAKTWSLVMTSTGTGTVNVEIDGVMVATGISVTGASTALGSFFLSVGQHYIAIGCNSFQTITAIGGSASPAVTFN